MKMGHQRNFVKNKEECWFEDNNKITTTLEEKTNFAPEEITTMKKTCSLLLLILVLVVPFCQLKAQYYYRDFVSTVQNMQQYRLLKSNKVTRVTLSSFEANGEPTENFVCEQVLNNSFTQVKTTSSSPLTGKSTLTNYYNSSGQLYRTVDSSEESLTYYQYQYDSMGRIAILSSVAYGYADKIKNNELHTWQYDKDGVAETMWRIKDNNDSLQIKFKRDQNGNVIEEQSFKKSEPVEKIYYYYDSLNRLTDIVRYNEKLQKLLPDYMFEYAPDNRLSQMITVQNGGVDYLIWRYEYDDKGLKKNERCYNKKKQLVGRIEYKYDLKGKS
jgi:hypothetical protein